ncbi:hypothetical protein [Spiroplasma poulsonii]|uniref:hypothetical protein n=1 Tax=Spiroplasma poulsonii TaxID=2138 RepID=UPI001F4D26E6|nr:hypothetical protein [Spiroplasma poulsonii]UNF62172.1 hypothetical protein MNU24_01525 [Spiroplasma poulsonii]
MKERNYTKMKTVKFIKSLTISVELVPTTIAASPIGKQEENKTQTSTYSILKWCVV